jgi:succinate dehydrogenase / fumarate reductase membrane anchor subunit
MKGYSSKWIRQRSTSVVLVPLTFWFVYNCIIFSKLNYSDLILFFSSYLNSSLFLLMMISMLVHAKLGCETIITDYVSKKKLKTIFILIINIIFFLAIFVSLISIVMIINQNK